MLYRIAFLIGGIVAAFSFFAAMVQDFSLTGKPPVPLASASQAQVGMYVTVTATVDPNSIVFSEKTKGRIAKRTTTETYFTFKEAGFAGLAGHGADSAWNPGAADEAKELELANGLLGRNKAFVGRVRTVDSKVADALGLPAGALMVDAAAGAPDWTSDLIGALVGLVVAGVAGASLVMKLRPAKEPEAAAAPVPSA